MFKNRIWIGENPGRLSQGIEEGKESWGDTRNASARGFLGKKIPDPSGRETGLKRDLKFVMSWGRGPIDGKETSSPTVPTEKDKKRRIQSMMSRRYVVLGGGYFHWMQTKSQIALLMEGGGAFHVHPGGVNEVPFEAGGIRRHWWNSRQPKEPPRRGRWRFSQKRQLSTNRLSPPKNEKGGGANRIRT